MQDFLQQLGDFLIVQLQGELLRQGHKLTGSLAQSIEYETKKAANSISLVYSFNNYGLALNDGIKPANIPYRRGSGAKKSKYIEGLKRWVKLKFGYSRQRAERVAFAIASKQKKQGYPLTGKIGWINITLETSAKEIQEFIDRWAAAQIEDLVEQQIKAA